MPIDYDPKDGVICWPEGGGYEAILESVEDKMSSKGNAMQEWKWRVYAPDGREQVISDYVVVPTGTFKIRQLAAALGQSDAYQAGQFQADDNIGCKIAADLIIEKQTGYDDKNKIRKYAPWPPAGGNGAKDEQQGDYTPPQPQRRGTAQPPRHKKPPPEQPFGDEQVFAESDVPF
jgi:hypothetical protein